MRPYSRARAVAASFVFTLLPGLEITMGSTEELKTGPPFYADRTRLLVYRDAQGNEQGIGTPEEWEKRRAHILANMQLVMGPLPDRSHLVDLDMAVEDTVDLPGLVRKKITFAVEPGDRVPAYLLVPKGLKEKAPVMLCLHQTTKIGKGEPAGTGGLPHLHYALELAERGYVTLAPDYPNYGDYAFDSYENGYASATMKGIWNHMRAVDLLQSLPDVDESRIGCIGHSLGGHNTMFVAAFDTRLKVMVSSCGFNSFTKYRGGDLTSWSHDGYMPRITDVYGAAAERMPFDFTEVTAALAPRALFVNAPAGDDNFEVSGVRDSMEAAMPVYRLFGAEDRLVAIYPDAGHDFPPEVREAAYSFIDRVLRERGGDMKLMDYLHWERVDAENLNFFKAIGVDCLLVLLPEEMADGTDHTDEFKQLRGLVEDHGLELFGLHCARIPRDRIVHGLPGKDEQIEDWIRIIRAIGGAGVPATATTFYAISHFRTSPTYGRGGARYSTFDIEEHRKAPPHFAEKVITEERLWENIEYFIQRVVPVAAEAGVRIALHPDDPPISEPLGGAARIVVSLENYQRIFDLVPSEANAMLFCQGCVAEMGEDVSKAIRTIGGQNKIVFVHFRNIRLRRAPYGFQEVFVDEGDVDMVRAMETYREAGFQGPFMMDHTPNIPGDSEIRAGRAYANGYIKALLQAVYR